LANAQEPLVLAGKQAIPLLLRVRQLDVSRLPQGAQLIEKATASLDRAALMPAGWIQRQMDAGRLLFMVDGLDETELELRDRHLIPWLRQVCDDFKLCRFLVSSRPAGYPTGVLRDLHFAECDLLDFTKPQIVEYACHWCSAVRLARNEPAEEARREGTDEGRRIVDGFKDHPYIRNLARNPLMLSAICLVNYFENGELPKDRARLYRLCVEGLLHHWDQRRGIHSNFGLEEKLRVCREVALAMQAADRAELEVEEVRRTFAQVLDDPKRADDLLEHVRFRTGLLIERRPKLFGFAHLTFQEYLAACAVHEGNKAGIEVNRLVAEHADGRWHEVLPLFCGLAPAPCARGAIELLLGQRSSPVLGLILAEAYLAAGSEIAADRDLRQRVLNRVGLLPGWVALGRFPDDEVSALANQLLGMTTEQTVAEAHNWLRDHAAMIDMTMLLSKLGGWKSLDPWQLAELVHLAHKWGTGEILAVFLRDQAILESPGPDFEERATYNTQAEVAIIGLGNRRPSVFSAPDCLAALLAALRVVVKQQVICAEVAYGLSRLAEATPRPNLPSLREALPLCREVAEKLHRMVQGKEELRVSLECLKIFERWLHKTRRSLSPGAQQSSLPL
jgi:hypothetical protein